jgi:hypothetical protein
MTISDSSCCVLNPVGCPCNFACLALNWDIPTCLQYCEHCRIELELEHHAEIEDEIK